MSVIPYRRHTPPGPPKFEVNDPLEYSPHRLIVHESEARRLLAQVVYRSKDLVLRGWDSGSEVKRITGREEFQFELAVPSAFKNAVLLNLVAERFDSVHEARLWLAARGVPCSFRVKSDDEGAP